MDAYPETADIETSSAGYASRFSGPVGRWFLAVQERVTISMLGSARAASVVDVGGGHGQLAVPLCRDGFKVTVLGSDQSCRRGIENLVKDGLCTFKVGNVIALPLSDRSVDIAVSFRLLPHCTQWQKLIAELCRVARSTIIVDYPVSQGFNALAPSLFAAKKKVEGNTREWRQFRHSEIRSEFERNGFAVERREGQFFFPMALHRALRSKALAVTLESIPRVLGLTGRFGSPVILKAVRKA